MFLRIRAGISRVKNLTDHKLHLEDLHTRTLLMLMIRDKEHIDMKLPFPNVNVKHVLNT